jgi:hypothetical protein
MTTATTVDDSGPKGNVMTPHPNAATLITPKFAIAKLIAGLRLIPADYKNIGHRSANVTVRDNAAKAMVLWAKGFADTIESQSVEEAVQAIRMAANQLANLDPHGEYIGNWGHVAVMVSGPRPQRYVLGNDGVLGSYWNESSFAEAVAKGHVLTQE